MTAAAGSAFDRIARDYDALWTGTDVGRLQREAVWRFTDRVFAPGDHILDLGCGTGADGAHLLSRGVKVSAIDASGKMVEAARQRGIHAVTLRLEELDQLERTFDGALSNFGALNCVENLSALRGPLSRLIRRGGYFACSVMGRFCAWESAYYLARGEFRKCARRWPGAAESRSIGVRVFYPTVKSVSRAFAPDFECIELAGIGVCVPPSFIKFLPAAVVALCGEVDRRIARVPVFRALSDHRLLIFRRR